MHAATPSTPESPENVIGQCPPRPKKYLVGVLYYGPIDREHDRCVKALRDHPLIENVLELTGCPYIDIGRGIIATAVLDNPELGGLLFIDHDMVFEPREAIATIESAIEADATVGAAYSMRKPGAIIGAVDGSKLASGEKVVFFDGGQRFPANYLGMGMTAIPRSVLVRLVEASKAKKARQDVIVAELEGLLSRVTAAVAVDGTPLDPSRAARLFAELVPELRDEDLPRLKTGISDAPVVPFFSLLQRNGYYFGEDVSFCVRSHLAGIGVNLDSRIRVYHKGSYCYGLEDVGMEVPYCHRLEVLDTPDPAAAPALFSKSPQVQSALAAQVVRGADGSTLRSDRTDDAPSHRADRTDEHPSNRMDGPGGYPRSFDPVGPGESAAMLADSDVLEVL